MPPVAATSTYSWDESDLESSAGSEASASWRGRRSDEPVSALGAALGGLRDVCASCEEALNEVGAEYLSFEFRPEWRLKLRKRTPLVTLGINLETGASGYELVAKRGTVDLPLWKFVRRIVAAPERGDVRVHSVALPLGMLAVEGVFTHDLRASKSRLSWRLCASWDVGPQHVGRKQRLPSPFPRLKPAARWDVRTLAAPELEGQLGDTSGVAYDIGRFHVSLPALQATLEL